MQKTLYLLVFCGEARGGRCLTRLISIAQTEQTSERTFEDAQPAEVC